jgi:hypothetical protein
VHNAVDAPLPITHLDGKIDTTALNASFRTRFGSNLRFNARYRYYDNDNKTPRTEFPGHVRFDAVWEDIGRITVPFGYSDEFCVGEINHLGANLTSGRSTSSPMPRRSSSSTTCRARSSSSLTTGDTTAGLGGST